MKKIFAIILLIIPAKTLLGQEDSTKNLTFSAYGEFYYSNDFTNSGSKEKPDFIYNHKKLNQISTNLLLFRSKYDNNTLRGNLCLMTGDYARYNLSAEPKLAQYLYEASIGIRLSTKNKLWLDAGIMPSHIGFESAIGADCWTLSRSILAENSPYYESGVKISYTSNSDKLNLAFLILNGWQKIRRINLIQRPSFGLQVNFRASNKILLNYSNFTGTENFNEIQVFRSFHNLYLQYDFNSKAGMIAGFDLGTDKFNTDDFGVWFSPVFMMKYNISDKINLAGRAELYHDKKQTIITTNTSRGFIVSGFSGNIDYKINESILFRIESKLFRSADRIFDNNSGRNHSLTSSLSFKL